MPRFVTEGEIERLKKADSESFQGRLYSALKRRTYKNTRHLGLVQPGDTQEWWHLCWERASDAAFVWQVERDGSLGEWIRHTAFWLRDREDTEWIGPWYRSHQRPLLGHLETAHVSLALCEILDLCAPLFSDEERESLEQALRTKGMEPCLRYCKQVQNAHENINNWYNVLLNGFGTCALYLNDEDALAQLKTLLPDAHSLYNADSYGESLQYSNYATLHLSFLQELIVRLRPDMAPLVSFDCYGNLMDWYAASFLYMKKWDSKDETVWPRSVNFADSAAVFRPTGDVLAQVSVRCGERLPREASLASWLFETAYANPEDGPDELATFGFYDQYRYHAVLMQPDMALAQQPHEAGLCTAQTFENGHSFLRDSWESPRGVLAIQGGYKSLNVSGHRHQDHGAFQFVQGNERMIIDGGHCCYRLNAQKFSVSTKQHATMGFLKRDDTKLVWNQPVDPMAGICQQKGADGNFYTRKEPLTREIMNRYIGNAHVLSVDLTDVYGDEIIMARRAFISVMPGAVFILDTARTKIPLRMQAHFPINNRDNRLGVHMADEHRFVFRRGGEALKLFECLCLVDGKPKPSDMIFDWGYCHQYYHPLHAQDGQSKEGAALIYTWSDKDEGTTHLRLCAIAADRDERITGWHIKPDEQGRWYIETPEKVRLLTLRIEGERAFLVQENTENRII